MIASAFPCRKLGEPRIHIAAKLDAVEIRTAAQQLRLPPQAAGTDHRAGGQVLERGISLGYQHVAGIGPLGDGGKRKCGRKLRGQVLEAVHGKIDAAAKQRLFNLPGKDALAISRGRNSFLHAVAGSANNLELRPRAPNRAMRPQ